MICLTAGEWGHRLASHMVPSQFISTSHERSTEWYYTGRAQMANIQNEDLTTSSCTVYDCMPDWRCCLIQSISFVTVQSYLYDKATMLSQTIKETPCKMWKLTESMNYATKTNTHRNVRPILTVTVRNGTSDLLNVQYQVAKVPANIISPRAETKNSPQNTPNILNAWR